VSDRSARYVPALGYGFLTRHYDRIAGWLPMDAVREALIAQAHVAPGHRVLDVGCGSGDLLLAVLRAAPGARAVGVDGDPEMLAWAREKAARAGVALELHQGLAHEAPFADASFDRVLSTLVFHHLTTDTKQRTLARIRAWLRPGGELHVADWGRPQDPLMGLAFLGVRLLDGFESTRDVVHGRFVPLLREAGFADAEETRRTRTIFGTLALYRARVASEGEDIARSIS
jgi:cyclopropane fatty-acyl-phospholipid synthase-like methyltransferase